MVGLAVGLAVLGFVKVADGVQVYVDPVPALTVNVCDPPLHIVYAFPVNVYVGNGLTTREPVVVFVQEVAAVPVNV